MPTDTPGSPPQDRITDSAALDAAKRRNARGMAERLRREARRLREDADELRRRADIRDGYAAEWERRAAPSAVQQQEYDPEHVWEFGR